MAYPPLVARPSQAQLSTLYGGGGLMSPPMNKDKIIPNATGLINPPSSGNNDDGSDDGSSGGGGSSVTGSALSQHRQARDGGNMADRVGREGEFDSDPNMGAGTTDAVGFATAIGNIAGMVTDPFGAVLGFMGYATGVTDQINNLLGVEPNPVALNSLGYAFGEVAKAMGLGEEVQGGYTSDGKADPVAAQKESISKVDATKEANPDIFGGGEATGGGPSGDGFGGGGDRSDGGMQEGSDVGAGLGDGPDRSSNSGTGGETSERSGGDGSGGGDGGDGGGDGGGGSCFSHDSLFEMGDGTFKRAEHIKVGDVTALGGRVTLVMEGDGLLEDWVQIGHTRVTTTHPVLGEDGIWRRAEDDPRALIIDKEKRLYSFFNENHRLKSITGVVFTDYLELPANNEVHDAFSVSSLEVLNKAA